MLSAILNLLDRCAGLLLPGLAAGVILAAVIARLLQVAFISVNVLNP